MNYDMYLSRGLWKVVYKGAEQLLEPDKAHWKAKNYAYSSKEDNYATLVTEGFTQAKFYTPDSWVLDPAMVLSFFIKRNNAPFNRILLQLVTKDNQIENICLYGGSGCTLNYHLPSDTKTFYSIPLSDFQSAMMNKELSYIFPQFVAGSTYDVRKKYEGLPFIQYSSRKDTISADNHLNEYNVGVRGSGDEVEYACGIGVDNLNAFQVIMCSHSNWATKGSTSNVEAKLCPANKYIFAVKDVSPDESSAATADGVTTGSGYAMMEFKCIDRNLNTPDATSLTALARQPRFQLIKLIQGTFNQRYQEMFLSKSPREFELEFDLTLNSAVEESKIICITDRNLDPFGQDRNKYGGRWFFLKTFSKYSSQTRMEMKVDVGTTVNPTQTQRLLGQKVGQSTHWKVVSTLSETRVYLDSDIKGTRLAGSGPRPMRELRIVVGNSDNADFTIENFKFTAIYDTNAHDSSHILTKGYLEGETKYQGRELRGYSDGLLSNLMKSNKAIEAGFSWVPCGVEEDSICRHDESHTNAQVQIADFEFVIVTLRPSVGPSSSNGPSVSLRKLRLCTIHLFPDN